MKTNLLVALLLATTTLSAQAATYTLLPSSTMSVTGVIDAFFSGTFNGTPFTSSGSGILVEQTPGSLTTSLFGTIDVTVSGDQISFVSDVVADSLGSWQPTNTPANFGLKSSVFMDTSAPFPDFTANVVAAVSGIATNLSGTGSLAGAVGNQTFSAPLGGFITSGAVDGVVTPSPALLPPIPLTVALSNIALTGISNGALVSDGLTETLTLPVNASATFTVLVPVNANGVVGTTTLSMTRHLSGEMIAVRAVPEPETYAMLLAGLGLVGFAVRRRSV